MTKSEKEKYVTFEQAKMLANICNYDLECNTAYDANSKKFLKNGNYCNYISPRDRNTEIYCAPTKDEAVTYLCEKIDIIRRYN